MTTIGGPPIPRLHQASLATALAALDEIKDATKDPRLSIASALMLAAARGETVETRTHAPELAPVFLTEAGAENRLAAVLVEHDIDNGPPPDELDEDELVSLVAEFATAFADDPGNEPMHGATLEAAAVLFLVRRGFGVVDVDHPANDEGDDEDDDTEEDETYDGIGGP